MVRIIEFDDHVRWVARMRMQPLSGNQAQSDMTKRIISNEYNTILLVKQETNILVPSVHTVELDPEGPVKAQFMLMDCLRGNVGIDLVMEIPNSRKSYVFSKMAEIQVWLSRVQLPRIGTITSRNIDGSFKQGPIPGIGGPFETATEFFQQ